MTVAELKIIERNTVREKRELEKEQDFLLYKENSLRLEYIKARIIHVTNKIEQINILKETL